MRAIRYEAKAARFHLEMAVWYQSAMRAIRYEVVSQLNHWQ